MSGQIRRIRRNQTPYASKIYARSRPKIENKNVKTKQYLLTVPVSTVEYAEQ